MGTALLILVAAAVIWYLFFIQRKESPRQQRAEPVNGDTGKPQESYGRRYTGSLDLNYLQQRWAERMHVRDEGKPCQPSWWWDEPTQAQLRRLADDLDRRELDLERLSPKTKGSVSDLIGWFEPADEDDKEVLRFFKVPIRALNQTRARYERKRILADAENQARWEQRSPSAEQKEFFEWFGLERPSGTSYQQADQLIREKTYALEAAGDPRLRDWSVYEAIFDEINDPDQREILEIKKPSRAVLKRALADLIASGHSYEGILSDLELLARKLPQSKGSTRLLRGDVPSDREEMPPER